MEPQKNKAEGPITEHDDLMQEQLDQMNEKIVHEYNDDNNDINEAEDDLIAQLAQLEIALETSENKVKEQQDSVLRARADVDNMRRRTEQEIDKARKYALERFANDILPTIDNLERTVAMADVSIEALKPMIEGVELTLKTLLDAVARNGIVATDPLNQQFDPEQHQAMSIQESVAHEPNTVIAVLQKGYLLNGRVIRPAMVMVSKTPSGNINVQA